MIAAYAASDATCSAHVPQAHITPEGHITWRSQTSRSAKRNTSLKKIAQRQKWYKIKILDAISICSKIIAFTPTK